MGYKKSIMKVMKTGQINLKDTRKKRVLIKDLNNQFPEMGERDLEVLLLDLRRIPVLFQKLITDTQVNLKTYTRYKRGKKMRTDYKLDLDTVLKIRDESRTGK